MNMNVSGAPNGAIAVDIRYVLFLTEKFAARVLSPSRRSQSVFCSEAERKYPEGAFLFDKKVIEEFSLYHIHFDIFTHIEISPHLCNVCGLLWLFEIGYISSIAFGTKGLRREIFAQDVVEPIVFFIKLFIQLFSGSDFVGALRSCEGFICLAHSRRRLKIFPLGEHISRHQMPKSPCGDIDPLYRGLVDLVAELRIEPLPEYQFDFPSPHPRIGNKELFEDESEVQGLMKPLDKAVADLFRLPLFLLMRRCLRFRQIG